VAGPPHPDVALGAREARLLERLLQGRDLGQQRGVEGQVCVGGVRGDADVRVAGVEVDGLGADKDRGLAVVADRLQRVEEHPPRDHIELIHATAPIARPSSP
jgi:hypothetical protein